MKKIILLGLFLCSTSAFAINDTTFITSHKEGTVIINGKVITYPKCIPSNASDQDKKDIQNKLNQARKYSNAIPQTVPVCEE